MTFYPLRCYAMTRLGSALSPYFASPMLAQKMTFWRCPRSDDPVAVDKLKAPFSGRIIYFDRLLPGFGLRITDKGAKSWVATYRVSRKSVMETLGTLAQIPRVDDARQRARNSMLKARAGTNPVVERKEREQREAADAEDAGKRTVSQSSICICASMLTPITAHHRLRRRGGNSRRMCCRGGAKRTLRRSLALMCATSSTACKVAALVPPLTYSRRSRPSFAWAVDQEFIEPAPNPTTGIKGNKNVERDRTLSDDEIVAVWSGCDKIGWPYGPLFKLLLLTAQRRNEVGQMEWSEIDLDKNIWTIPGKRAKNGKPHIVHLSRLAAEIIASLPRINGSKYVFTTSGETPVNGWSASKTSLDKYVIVEDPWTLHDLRRTAASGMAQLGIAPQVVDRVLNHTAGTIKGVARIYNRYEYRDERKGALRRRGLGMLSRFYVQQNRMS